MSVDASPIVAIATAAGRGGIGVVRLSGKNLWPVLQAVCGKDESNTQPRHAYYQPFLRADGTVIDHGLVLYFKGPHSYTGEDVIEFQGHGGPVVMQMLVARCLEAGKDIGLRLAEPGEFTQRAFLNDKMDLAQAEAVSDLIEASTEAAARSATESLSGAFSRVIQELVDKVTSLRMLVEATLDFPEEEIDFLEKSDARGQLAGIRTALAAVFAEASQGALLRDGLNVVLAGKPNVGKSSLLNALAGSDVAIVTPIAGTTRDKVSQLIQIEGMPLNIIDTAGIRGEGSEGGPDEVEKIGIQRTWAEVEKAGVILHMLSAVTGPTLEDEEIAARFPGNVPVIAVWNKIDESGHKPSVEVMDGLSLVYLSAQTGAGVDLLRKELLRTAGWEQTVESRFIARERHLMALRQAGEHLEFASQHAAPDNDVSDKSLDLFAEELRLAQEALSSITGRFTPDDLLGVIFSRFCIGK